MHKRVLLILQPHQLCGINRLYFYLLFCQSGGMKLYHMVVLFFIHVITSMLPYVYLLLVFTFLNFFLRALAIFFSLWLFDFILIDLQNLCLPS